MARPRPAPDDLRRLAAAHGVATSYRNERREPVDVDADVVVKVLGLLDVEAATESDRRAGLAKLTKRERASALPPTIAVRLHGRPQPMPGAVALEAEDGTRIALRDNIPGDLRPGWYRMHTRDGQQATLVAAAPSSRLVADVGLDAAALRAAVGAVLGDRRSRRSAAVRGLDCP